MPMPRIRLKIIVSTSDRNMLSLPIEIIKLPKLVAAPVSVIMPMTMPTTAQARPTGSACRAPSAIASSAC